MEQPLNIEQVKKTYLDIVESLLHKKDDYVLNIIESYTSNLSKFTFTELRMILNAIKPVSNELHFKPHIETLKKELELRCGQQLY